MQSDRRPIGREGFTSHCPTQSASQALLELCSQPLCIVDAGSRVLWANPAFFSLCGYDPAELLGFPITRILTRLIAGAEADEGALSIKGGGQAIVRIRERRAGTAESSTLCVALEDVSSSRRLEERARRAERAQSLAILAAGAAHDFNNVLMAISGYASLLETEVAAHGGAETARIIRTTADRGLDLCSRLLAVLRAPVDSPGCVDVHALLRELAELLRTLTARVNVCTAFDATESKVWADQGDLFQAFLNLLVNSVDSMPSGGDLTIRTCSRNGTISVEISDTGSGIDAEILPHIFEPFFTTKACGRGTGMGLAVVQRVVKKMNGEIRVSSKPQAGTSFEITLPLNAARQKSASAGEV